MLFLISENDRVFFIATRHTHGGFCHLQSAWTDTPWPPPRLIAPKIVNFLFRSRWRPAIKTDFLVYWGECCGSAISVLRIGMGHREGLHSEGHFWVKSTKKSENTITLNIYDLFIIFRKYYYYYILNHRIPEVSSFLPYNSFPEASNTNTSCLHCTLHDA